MSEKKNRVIAIYSKGRTQYHAELPASEFQDLQAKKYIRGKGRLIVAYLVDYDDAVLMTVWGHGTTEKDQEYNIVLDVPGIRKPISSMAIPEEGSLL